MEQVCKENSIQAKVGIKSVNQYVIMSLRFLGIFFGNNCNTCLLFSIDTKWSFEGQKAQIITIDNHKNYKKLNKNKMSATTSEFKQDMLLIPAGTTLVWDMEEGTKLKHWSDWEFRDLGRNGHGRLGRQKFIRFLDQYRMSKQTEAH